MCGHLVFIAFLNSTCGFTGKGDKFTIIMIWINKIFSQYINNHIYISAKKNIMSYTDKVVFAWDRHDCAEISLNTINVHTPDKLILEENNTSRLW